MASSTPKDIFTKDTSTKVVIDVQIVADSHSKNLDYKILEEATNLKVDKVIAYTVDEDDDAKFKDRNFLKVVPETLARRKCKTLILQGGCNEISNIKLSKNPSPEQIKKWEEKIIISRTKLFELAENSLKKTNILKKL